MFSIWENSFFVVNVRHPRNLFCLSRAGFPSVFNSYSLTNKALQTAKNMLFTPKYPSAKKVRQANPSQTVQLSRDVHRRKNSEIWKIHHAMMKKNCKIKLSGSSEWTRSKKVCKRIEEALKICDDGFTAMLYFVIISEWQIMSSSCKIFCPRLVTSKEIQTNTKQKNNRNFIKSFFFV